MILASTCYDVNVKIQFNLKKESFLTKVKTVPKSYKLLIFADCIDVSHKCPSKLV